MMTRAERLELFRSYAREKDCIVCRDWPRAEKAWRRSNIDCFPPKGACPRCWLAFLQHFRRKTNFRYCIDFVGALGEIRTPDPQIRSLFLTLLRSVHPYADILAPQVQHIDS